jgi:pyruvate/2-oxoglutarate dehydrogenase complex dihydrolipoamide dehydrogenase (E3) component
MERPVADTSFDVVVIGSGPGGYVTAIRAAQLGFKTAIVEKAYLGGICNNWGCIPTKALLRSAEIFHYMKHAKDYGLSADNVSFDPKAVIARSRAVVKRLNGGVEFLMNKNKITIIWGNATLEGGGKFSVKKTDAPAPKGALGEGSYQAKHIIVATGARPRALPGLEGDKKLVWTYFEAMNPDKMPKSLLVVGSGAIGIEFASFYRTLGAEVTVVEVLPQIMPVEDAEIAGFARKQFEKQGIKILTGAKVTKLMIPGCTYCHPQVASVGLTEAKAKEAGKDIRVGRFPFVGNGKAIAQGEDQGMVKVIFDKKTGQLLGAHMVGSEVTELIQGFVVAMNLETTEEELFHTIFPHPTISETMKEAVLDAYGRVLNM